MIAFGPIPSRRLGRSLGINNIPHKNCSYSCIYCQLGKTLYTSSERRVFYSCEEIYSSVKEKVEKAGSRGEHIDYLSFVPDGEPTLDTNLGKEIDMLKSLGIRIAVFTNGTLLSDEDVRTELSKADLVSVKVDTDDISIWKKINLPDKAVNFNSIFEGLSIFKDTYEGILVTETMLVKGINDNLTNISILARYLADINPNIAYILVPTRPPSFKNVKPPDDTIINSCFKIFSENIDYVECLTDYEGNLFAFTGNIESDILSITSVHPMRKDAVEELLRRAGKNWDVIDSLISKQKLGITEYNNNTFYVNRLNSNLDIE